MQMNPHDTYMERCLQLALNGAGTVAPNPMVGAVVVHDGRIVGEGFHAQYGEAHAEVHAINSVKQKDLLRKSTLYVNLEPCAHHGKTPPCADLIIKVGIPEVVIGAADPFVQVNGKGIEKLQNAGCKVVVGVLKEQCEFLNRRFYTFHQKKRPYVMLKWAQSMDGFIDCIREQAQSKPNWLTHPYTRVLVHKWRCYESAIMVATNTAFVDNPKLNARDWYGNNPVRIVIDRELRLPENLSLFDQGIPTLVFTAKYKESIENLKFFIIDFSKNIVPQILAKLHELNIQSLIVEGGATLLNSFISCGLWDEARIFTAAHTKYNFGIIAPKLNSLAINELYSYNNDKLEIYYNHI